MRIALASDHAGFDLKQRVADYLRGAGHEVADFGTHSETPVDYPDFVQLAARAVAAGECARGIVFGGSGNGEAMAANRIRGVRCALVWNLESAKLASAHNAANLLSIGARLVAAELVIPIIDTWLMTPFEAGRHARRIAKLDEL